jgi:hypothetical protein
MPNVLTVLSSLFNGDREFVDAATNEPLAVSITFVSYCGEWAAGRPHGNGSIFIDNEVSNYFIEIPSVPCSNLIFSCVSVSL